MTKWEETVLQYFVTTRYTKSFTRRLVASKVISGLKLLDSEEIRNELLNKEGKTFSFAVHVLRTGMERLRRLFYMLSFDKKEDQTFLVLEILVSFMFNLYYEIIGFPDTRRSASEDYNPADYSYVVAAMMYSIFYHAEDRNVLSDLLELSNEELIKKALELVDVIRDPEDGIKSELNLTDKRDDIEISQAVAIKRVDEESFRSGIEKFKERAWSII